MPRRDETGPDGEGPRTGGEQGNCSPSDKDKEETDKTLSSSSANAVVPSYSMQDPFNSIIKDEGYFNELSKKYKK